MELVVNPLSKTGSPLPSNEAMNLGMEKSAMRSGTRRFAVAGFSIIELVVSLCVMLILTAVAIPSLLRSLRTYQLNDAAMRLTAMLKFTRFEAVRRNRQVNFLMQASGTGYLVGTDLNGDGTLQATEKQELIAGFATLLPSGSAPPPTAITTALGGSPLTTVYGSSTATVTFDARGAIRVGGNVSSSVFVFYVGSTSDPNSGYRAVILLPGGTTQMWSAPSGGPWQQIG